MGRYFYRKDPTSISRNWLNEVGIAGIEQTGKEEIANKVLLHARIFHFLRYTKSMFEQSL